MKNFSPKQKADIQSVLLLAASKLSFLWQLEPLDGDQTEDVGKELTRLLDEVNGNE